MKFIIGKKISMTQVWQGDRVMAVTQVKAGPCTVVQVKDATKDGYKAVQLGFDVKKEKNIAKPQRGHLKNLPNHRFLKEFRLTEKDVIDVKRGDIIDVTTFSAGDPVKVTGTSKGKGFQGVVKRWGFHGQNSTHGHKDQERMSGSIGSGGVQHVFKGTKMGGRTGDEKVTIANLEIVDIDKDTNTLFIKGAVPGARNSLVLIYGPGDLQLTQEKSEATGDKEEPVSEKVELAETETGGAEIPEVANEENK